MTDKFGLDKNDKFVDIHGRELSSVSIDRKGEETTCILLSDLKQTGVAIYKKSQYAKLSTVNKEFGPDFVDFMLEQAKSYMLANRISFSHEQIMESINNAKRALIDNKSVPVPIEKDFLKDRKIETRSDDEILIQVSNLRNPTPSPTPSKQVSPGFKKFPIKSPRQPPLARENDSYSDIRVKSTQNLDKKFPKKGFREQKSETGWNKMKEIRKKSLGPDAFKLPQPKNQPVKKLVYNITIKEHDVMVTVIDKPNCIWVRDLANTGLLEQIHKKVNEEAKYQPVATKPWHLNTVYMAKDEDAWFRCKIVRFSPLTVFFLDYGNVAEVKEIKQISEELAKTPCMAIRVTFKEAQYSPRLEDEIRIKPFVQNPDGTLFVNILTDKTNPATPLIESLTPASCQDEKKSVSQQSDDENWEESYKDPKPSKKSEAPAFFKKPQSLSTLHNDQRVVIIAEKDGNLYLRTKTSFEKLKEIEGALGEYVKTAKAVGRVEVEQLVLCESTDGKFYRAVVKKVNKSNVEIELLDYPETFTVEPETVKSINEQLSREPITYISGGKLYGFEEEPLDENSKQLIQECISKRQKFTVVLGFDDELDLFDGSQLLSEHLKKLQKTHERVLLKDMKTFTPETGVKRYFCGSYKNSKYFSVVPSDELEKHADYILRSEIEDKVPYIPIAGEICLCLYIDNWYRCVVTRVFDTEYEVLLLDFGNIELMKKENLRKPYDDITKIPVLGLPCVLINLPEHHKNEELLRKMLIEGELYNVNVIEISEGKWQVEIPSVYKRIEEQML